MSGLTNFLAPYSNLIFSHRNTIIVVLGIILGCTALYALYGHWRVQRLEREVRVARSAGRQPMGRYAGVQPVAEESPPEAPGGLPPVKGGRTYARNLGSALQKAGMSPSGQPIYSPPIPQGWAPNTAASQPIAPPPPQPLYSPASSTWGAPAPSPSWPSAYPAQGPGRPGMNQPMPPVPTYQPPASPSQPPQPPAFYPPAYPQGPQMAPAVNQVPAQFAPPPTPVTPAMPAPVPAGQPPDPASQEPGRRGKGKRRRFNLSVLESLEKIVQPRQQVQPTQISQPNPAAAQVPPVVAPSAPMPGPPPLPAWGPAVKPAVPPASEPAVVSAATPADAPAEAPSLALNFGPPPPASVPAVEPVVEARAEPKPDARQSMRSMLFGEEPTASTEGGQVEDASEPVQDPVEAAGVAAPDAEVEPLAASGAWQESADASGSTGKATDEPVAAEYQWQAGEPDAGGTEPPTETDEPAAESHEPEAESRELQAQSHDSELESRDLAAESHESADSWGQRETKPWEPFTWSSETSAVDEVPAPVENPQAEEHTPEPAMTGSFGEPLEPPAAPDGGGAAGTMVIIEDDQTVAQYYATLFQGNGYRVEVANDGVSGVDLCTRVQPQVILLDVMMPRQNGILVLQTLRASDETKNTPVVVMSNFSEPTLIKRALQLGALEYVIKTQVEGPALLAAVPRWMNREKAFAA